jgi:hypothetical protein
MTLRICTYVSAAGLGLLLCAVQPVQAANNGEAMAPIALNSLASPPPEIASAAVVDDKGAVIGAVQKVDLDQAGKPTRVEIALLGSERIVALNSAELSYDQSHNVVTAGLDKSQIAQLPPAG